MDYTHYIAIDFGTAGSGFAYATCINPDKLRVFNDWPGLNNEGYKTPTVLLIDPHGELEAFGQEAYFIPIVLTITTSFATLRWFYTITRYYIG